MDGTHAIEDGASVEAYHSTGAVGVRPCCLFVPEKEIKGVARSFRLNQPQFQSQFPSAWARWTPTLLVLLRRDPLFRFGTSKCRWCVCVARVFGDGGVGDESRGKDLVCVLEICCPPSHTIADAKYVDEGGMGWTCHATSIQNIDWFSIRLSAMPTVTATAMATDIPPTPSSLVPCYGLFMHCLAQTERRLRLDRN